MIPARESLARRVARELLTEMNIVDVPVDPAESAQRKQLLFEERGDFPPDVYGALFRSGNQFGIIVSKACPGDGHRRFTIAHELGHYHLPDHVDRLFQSGGDVAPSLGGHFRSKKDPIEVEADCFASELLMPERFVKPVVDRSESGLSCVLELARLCGTSLSAASIRYAALARVPTVVLLSRDGVVEWAASSPALWAHRWAKVSWKGDWAPRGSATRQLATAPDRVSRGDSAESSLLLCEWLEGAPAGVTVVEQARGLGGYARVLTVLTAAELPDAEEWEEQEHVDVEEGDWRSALRGYRLG